MDKHDNDLIIVGRGIAGLASAIIAAGAEMKVTLIERDISGVLTDCIDELVYHHAIKRILSDYASLDITFTPLARRAFWITTPDGHAAIECVKPPSDNSVGFVANRPELDRILLERFKSLGGNAIIGKEVTSVSRDDDGNINGVICEHDKTPIHAPLVIIADGPNSYLADSILERNPLLPNEELLVAKEVLTGDDPTPSYHLTGNDDTAASIILLGDPLGVGFSWARIIAWREYLTLKIYVPLDLINQETGIKPLMESLKMHPSVEPIIRGLKHSSFYTQLIPIGGFDKNVESLWGDGYMITGKAARLYHPFDCRMSDYSIYSGEIAARAAISARHDRRPSHPSEYPRLLEDSFILKDRKSMSDIMSLIRDNKSFSSSYPQFMLDALAGVFTMDERSKKTKKNDMERTLRGLASPWELLRDLYLIYKKYG